MLIYFKKEENLRIIWTDNRINSAKPLCAVETALRNLESN